MKNNILFCLFFVLISCNDNGGSLSRDYNEPGTPLILISIDGVPGSL
jgi:hypothetical protein